MRRQRELLQTSQKLQTDAAVAETAAQEVERRAAEFEGVSIEVLKEDVDAAQSEAALANERSALLALEASEVTRQRDELADHLENTAEAHAAALRPVVETLRGDVGALAEVLDGHRVAAAAASAELQAAQQRAAALEAEVPELTKDHRAESNRLLTVQALPEKARRQADLAVAEVAAARQLLAAAEAKQLEAEAGARAAAEVERQKQALRVHALSGLERARIMAETKERHAADVARDVELAAVEAERALADGADLDMALRALLSELRQQRLSASAVQRERDSALRTLKAADEALERARGELPQLRVAVELLEKDKAAVAEALEAQEKDITALKKEVDIKIAAYLEEETHGKDKTALFGLMQKELQLLEQELSELKDEGRQRGRLLADMTAQRDRAARLVASVRNRVRAALGVARTRARQVEDVKTMKIELTRRSRDFEKLYDLVRNQRNKFVALIAAAGQARGEMAGRLRLLAAEADVLHGEAAHKGALISKAKQQRAVSVKERDALRGELHDLGRTFREQHEAIEEAAAAIESLGTEVGRADKDMERSRRAYEGAIQARNCTGLMLIDRGDELSVLFERSHALDARLKAARMTLQQQEDENRVLKLQVCELERSVAATRKCLPDVAGIDEGVAEIKAALLRAERESEALSLRLEDPSEPTRYRLLGGRIPDREELVAKLQTLEERLGMKREELLEKGIVLDEVSALTGELRSKAAATREERVGASHVANGYQQRLRQVTARIMAAISELSLYQATALKLHAERAALEELVENARRRLAAGVAPTQDAQGEWERLQREAATAAELQRRREEEAAYLDAKGHLLETTAEPRPNAYVPEDIAIPRPFGALAPFKPSARGATMRHTRAPVAREVVI